MEIVAAVLSVFVGGLASVLVEVLIPLLRRLFGLEVQGPPRSYSEQIAQLTQRLVEASSDVDQILEEMTTVSRQREAAIAELEQQLATLSEREGQLRQRVEALERTPLPAVEYFASMLDRGEKRR